MKSAVVPFGKPWQCLSMYCRKCQRACQYIKHKGDKHEPKCSTCDTPLYVVAVLRESISKVGCHVDFWDCPPASAPLNTNHSTLARILAYAETLPPLKEPE